MKKLVLSGKKIITGAGSLSYLKELSFHRAIIITGGRSMLDTGVIGKASTYLKENGCDVLVHSGIGKNPTIEEVFHGLSVMQAFKPEAVIAIGGGSAMDCAKAMLLFYEFPELNFENVLSLNAAGKIPVDRNTALICVPSTSGTGSEMTRGTVITDTKKELKVPIMTDCLRPDIAILDAELTMTMPEQIVAETGMDALTHAIEAYTNHNLDDFDEGLCKSAIEGILKWLYISYDEKTLEAREKVHHYQAMAGIGFANVGLGMVHGIAHSYGAVFNMAHGLTNAVILPYVLQYNSRNEAVKEKLSFLSYHCRCKDIIEEIKELNYKMKIPQSFLKAGITQKQFEEKFPVLLDHAMLGATNVNPVKMDVPSMKQMLNATFYGTEIDF